MKLAAPSGRSGAAIRQRREPRRDVREPACACRAGSRAGVLPEARVPQPECGVPEPRPIEPPTRGGRASGSGGAAAVLGIVARIPFVLARPRPPVARGRLPRRLPAAVRHVQPRVAARPLPRLGVREPVARRVHARRRHSCSARSVRSRTRPSSPFSSVSRSCSRSRRFTLSALLFQATCPPECRRARSARGAPRRTT